MIIFSGPLTGILPSSKTRVRCLYCGVHIPKAEKCIEQHVNGSRHEDNMQLVFTSGIIFKDDVLHCKPCNRELTEEESVLEHTLSDDHANWMATVEDLIDGEFINLESYLETDIENEKIYCDVCKCSFVCTLASLEQHVNSYDHRSELVDKLMPLNGVFPVEGDDEVWCKVCNVNFENRVQKILDHIDDDLHSEWFAEMDDLIEHHEVTMQGFLTEKDQKMAYCHKCAVSIICNNIAIQSHVNSDLHLSQFD